MMRCFVSADFRNMEGRLTAYYSQDPVLIGELEEELVGGPKLHAKNAAMLYNIPVEDTTTHLVNLSGQMVPAYNGGKRLGLAYFYGMKYKQMNKQFWCGEEFAKESIASMAAKYELVEAWRKELSDNVFGVSLYGCSRCGYQQEYDPTDCPNCTNAGFPVPLRWVGMARFGERVHSTAFGRRRFYLGRRKEGMNALAAQDPQSSGASVWDITFIRLHGYDPLTDSPWPSPNGSLAYDPRMSVSTLFRPSEIFVASGHYDSFYVEAPLARQEEVTTWLAWTMEQPWSHLNNLRLPVEVSSGFNMGKYNDNPKKGALNLLGLKEADNNVPFSRTYC